MSEEHKQESWRAVDLLFHAPDGTSIKLHGSDIERFSQRCVINLAGHLNMRRGLRGFWDGISPEIQAEIIGGCETAIMATVEGFQRRTSAKAESGHLLSVH